MCVCELVCVGLRCVEAKRSSLVKERGRGRETISTEMKEEREREREREEADLLRFS